MKHFFLGIACIVTIFSVSAQKQIPAYLDASKPIELRVENALSLMTLEEKVAMCHGQSKFSSKGVARLGIPEIWTTDGPHGIREEVFWDQWSGAAWTNDSCTAFPALTCLAATFNPEMAKLYGISIGEEARYRNKAVLLAPGLNIYRTPLNGRNFEYMGEDPYLTSLLAVPYIQGVQSNGVAACVKHYALNNQERDRMSVSVQVSERALREIYLPAFRAAVIKGESWSIMGAYNKLRGQHCCHNDYLLNQILKKEWKFDGVVISDWGGVHDTDEAVNNGLDIEMGSGRKYNEYYLANPFLKGLKEGKYSVNVLDDKVRRILRMIYRTIMNNDRPYGSMATEAHAQVTRKIATEGIVLLKNVGNVFPINTQKVKRIVVIGENAVRMMTVGGGSSSLKAKEEISPLKGLQSRFGKDIEIQYAKGYEQRLYKQAKKVEDTISFAAKSDSLRSIAINLAKTADLVLFIGGLNKEEGQDSEGDDRNTYELPYKQNELIESLVAVNKNVAVVLVSGNAVAMPWANKVQAIVQSWYLGSQAGNALADVLSGDVNPSGKMPITVAAKLNDYGSHSFGQETYPGIDKKQTYTEDILVGYRWFDTKKIVPTFAFGHGLSYTTFAYSKPVVNLKVASVNDTVKVSFTLTNSGKVAGAEVPQLYVGMLKSKITRASKELKAFQKVFLQPGESKQLILNVAVKDLAFYNESIKNWDIEAGAYKFTLGSSSRDSKGEVMVIIK